MAKATEELKGEIADLREQLQGLRVGGALQRNTVHSKGMSPNQARIL